MKLSGMAILSNSRCQTRKERPNRFTYNGDMNDITKRPASKWGSLWHLSNYREAKLLKSARKEDRMVKKTENRMRYKQMNEYSIKI